MKTEIRLRSLSDSAELRAYAKRQLGFCLSRFGGAIDAVVLRVSDLNGPKGGVDKHCQISARLRGGGTVTLSAQSTDARIAIAQATERAVRRIVRELSRTRTWGAAG
jgi:putative sigma-54 modulation protein